MALDGRHISQYTIVILTIQILELPAGIEPAISRLWATSGNHYTRREPISIEKKFWNKTE
jgi:hypothetical protein